MCFVVDLTRTVSKKRNRIMAYFLFIRHFIWVFAEEVWPFPGLFKHCLIVYKSLGIFAIFSLVFSS